VKDFLGQEYDVGDKVLYAAGSGRSITMVLAEVVGISKHYRDPDEWHWVKVGMDDPVPHKRRWNRETKEYDPLAEEVDTEIRVSVQPLNSSRWEQHSRVKVYTDKRTGETIKNPYDDEHWGAGTKGNLFKDHVEITEFPPKPVTLSVTDNIVLWRKKKHHPDCRCNDCLSKESHPEWKACKR